MSAPQTFQIPLEIAEIYEETFVPALFADWAPHVVDMADVSPGQSMRDVVCGPGIVAREAHAVLAAFTTDAGRPRSAIEGHRARPA